MNSESSGGKLERFFNGKGFYIVLFLCAATIGVSAWLMAAGGGRMEEATEVLGESLETKPAETVIIPPRPTALPMPTLIPTPTPAEAEAPADGSVEVFSEAEAPVYMWPLAGEIARGFSNETLHYDETLQDWRVHGGIDILAPIGTPVCAAHAGTVERVYEDDLLGTVVVIDHGDGVKTSYANLESAAVEPGFWVSVGAAIGTVGHTALAETAQEPHLHFAVTVNGEPADPTAYLPA